MKFSSAERTSRALFGDFRTAVAEKRALPTVGDPEADKATRGAGRRYFRDYIAWLWPFRVQILIVFVVAICSAGLSLILPRATMYIIDHVLPERRWTLLNQLGLALLAIIFVQQSFELTRNWLSAKLNARIVFRLRQRLFDRLLALPLHALGDMRTGGITSRLSGDVDAVSGLVQTAVITPSVSTVKILLTLTILVTISWQMALAATLLIPPLVTFNLVYLKRVRPIYRAMRKDRAAIDGRVVETFGGIRVVRAFGRERTEARRYAVQHHTVIRKQLWVNLFEFAIWTGWGVLMPLCGLLVIWLGGVLVLQGKATIGGIIAFQMYLMMLLMPMNAIVTSFGQTQQTLAAMERIFDVLRTPIDKPDRPAALPAPRTVERIEFDDVTFAYGDDRPVLRDIKLAVRGGMTVALVGPSGAGKTTLTSLVARFHDPTAGALKLNGVDLRDIRLEEFRSLLGLVQQDVFLFEGTIAENIAYGRRDATMDEIVDAAQRANVHDFIRTFPDGYQTMVGERGVRLSGGQAQRVTIARAMLANPQILILDEATSNLDTESEQRIQESLRLLFADRTVFVIAHRLSTIVDADLIVVLENGQIRETGTHYALMASDSKYREMVERQQRHMAISPAEADGDGSWLA